MEFNFYDVIHACYESDLSISGLIKYSHFVPVIISSVISLYVFFNNKKNYLAKVLLLISITFSAWAILDYLTWTMYAKPEVLMFSWAPLELLSIIGYILISYFTYYTINKKPLGKYIDYLSVSIISLFSILSITKYNIDIFSINTCIPIVGGAFSNITFFIEVIIALSVIIYLSLSFFRKKISVKVFTSLLLGVSVFFSTFTLLGYISLWLGNYTYELYGLFSIVVYFISLAYIVVKEKIFNIKLISAQILVAALLIAAVSQLFFVENRSSYLLVAMTILFTLLSGVSLVRSVKKEVQAREEIEELAIRLRSVNKVLSHDVKGALGKHAMLFRALADGDFGPVPEQARVFIEQSAKDATKLVDAIMIMLQSGHELTFHPAKFNMGSLVKEIVDASKTEAEKKGLTINLRLDDTSSLEVDLDQAYIKMHVVQNLISNAINYTLKGNIDVYIGKSSESKIMFSVKDSGIGISAADAPKMFSEGGHGEHSSEVNVHSTGYGLFSAKRVVDACGGKIWFDSKGIPGEGTTFFVELPLVVQTTEEKIEDKKA